MLRILLWLTCWSVLAVGSGLCWVGVAGWLWLTRGYGIQRCTCAHSPIECPIHHGPHQHRRVNPAWEMATRRAWFDVVRGVPRGRWRTSQPRGIVGAVKTPPESTARRATRCDRSSSGSSWA